MAKWINYGEANWWYGTELESDGWLLQLENKACFPAAFFIQSFRLASGLAGKYPRVTVELISDSIANPGDSLFFKFRVADGRARELVGLECKLHYGTGMGEYWKDYVFTFKE